MLFSYWVVQVLVKVMMYTEKTYLVKHLSAGDLLRVERNDPNSKNGELMAIISEGKICSIYSKFN